MREVGTAFSVARKTPRRVYLLPLHDLASFPGRLDMESPRFVLFLAADFTATPTDLRALSDRIVDAGCVYFCAWGPGCERMHDIVDDSIVIRGLEGEAGGAIMTTWHDREPLEEATEFALRMAEPDDYHSEKCDAVVLATVADRDWARRVAGVAQQLVRQPDAADRDA